MRSLAGGFEVAQAANSVAPGSGSAKMVAKHVSVFYGETQAVKDVDLEVRREDVTALIGPSGCGKSTLLRCLNRMNDDIPGCRVVGDVLLEGEPIYGEAIDVVQLRARVGMVFQKPNPFPKSVYENVAYGPLADASDDAVSRAIEAASAREFIERLPEGLDTQIGAQGIRLSGGQRQRIAIARAFLKDAPVIILDEATSALDNRAEREIQQALQRLSEGRTTLVIAHRLSSIEHADRIAVLDHGRIVDTGTHHQLLERNGLYAGLYRFQFNHDADPVAEADSLRS